ncbi:hypothetical protein [Actinoplanes sp. NPDC023714]|uniref:hypothetical protein n=1 Tax=Actinoplanes sp. NPDC023714 TaxID=3154322 RepID=UPI0033F030ED
MTTHTMIDAARAEALFASILPTGSLPGAAETTTAIRSAVRRYGGVRGCAAEMAHAYGEHPETAARRMRWARGLAHELRQHRPTPNAGLSGKEEK